MHPNSLGRWLVFHQLLLNGRDIAPDVFRKFLGVIDWPEDCYAYKLECGQRKAAISQSNIDIDLDVKQWLFQHALIDFTSFTLPFKHKSSTCLDTSECPLLCIRQPQMEDLLPISVHTKIFLPMNTFFRSLWNKLQVYRWSRSKRDFAAFVRLSLWRQRGASARGSFWHVVHLWTA
jgi:hypothetical protein